MSSLNRVQLIGNLGRDPESRSFQNGGKVVNLNLAVTERWKKDGETKERTEWISVAIMNENIGSIAERYLRKGSKVYIEGKFSTRKWKDQQGNDRYSTEVVLQGFDGKLVLLDGKGSERQEQRGGGGSAYDADLDGDDVPFVSCDPRRENRRKVAL
jgi:single-strand DNA-binding protein